ncbi:MAG: hypothetical protein SFV15_00495 [Polyangiaceae bacterium]|nr:hypothetical protein [Polyangiaceae bacterium]
MSPFGEILDRFRQASGTMAAALVDREGETVDFTTDGAPFDVLVAAAEWQIVMGQVRVMGRPSLPVSTELFVRARRRSYAVFWIDEGYSLVCVLKRHGFEVSRRATLVAVREIVAEAGWPERPSAHRASGTPERWARVEVHVQDNASRRPTAICMEGTWQQLNIIGRYTADLLARGEQAYRAQLDSGAELTLVREPLGAWYADV